MFCVMCPQQDLTVTHVYRKIPCTISSIPCAFFPRYFQEKQKEARPWLSIKSTFNETVKFKRNKGFFFKEQLHIHIVSEQT